MVHEETLALVARLLREVMNEPEGLGPEITRDTAFSADLELESIELVALAEKLGTHYGPRVDFVAWLSGMELDAILSLTVGDLVEHIDTCLAG